MALLDIVDAALANKWILLIGVTATTIGFFALIIFCAACKRKSQKKKRNKIEISKGATEDESAKATPSAVVKVISESKSNRVNPCSSVITPTKSELVQFANDEKRFNEKAASAREAACLVKTSSDKKSFTLAKDGESGEKKSNKESPVQRYESAISTSRSGKQQSNVSFNEPSSTALEFPDLDQETRHRVHVARWPTVEDAAKSVKIGERSDVEWDASRWARFADYYKQCKATAADVMAMKTMVSKSQASVTKEGRDSVTTMQKQSRIGDKSKREPKRLIVVPLSESKIPESTKPGPSNRQMRT